MLDEKRNIRFSVLMPVYNVETQWLEQAIESVKRQTYENWQLCIVDDCSTDLQVKEYLRSVQDDRIKIEFLEKNQGISGATNRAAEVADGDYLILMDNDDELTEDALQEFDMEIRRSGAEVLYSDQDIIDGRGNCREPFCKPDWSPDLILSQMYVGHLLGFSRELFEKTGGFRSEFDGSQDYDLFLRMTEQTEKIAHVPKILYHWRAIPSSTAANPESKPYAQIVGQKALQEHLDRTLGEGEVSVEETEDFFVYDVRYHLRTQPLVSVIIPTKDHADLLKNAVESIENRTIYPSYEIIILDNNSSEPETFSYFSEVARKYDNVRVEQAAFPFNWSKLNNLGISKARGDVFIFLNNDVEVIAKEWMTRLVEKCLQNHVGTVGGLLLYEDNTIQHAGVVIGMGGWAEHVFKGMKPVHYGSPFISPMVTRNVSAVTGACMAISRKTLEEIGMFDEEFIICGSDVEICLRAMEQGYRNIYDPYVRLYHLESKTRDSYIPEIDSELSAKMYSKYLEKGDPFYNVQLDMFSYIPKMKEEPQRARTRTEILKEDYWTVGPEDGDVDTHIAEINPYIFRKGNYSRRRINLLLPSINPEHVFGGISTAIKFFEQLAKDLDMDRRIILVDAVPSQEAIRQYEDRYQFVRWEEESDSPNQIVPYSERLDWSLSVSLGDYFMFTGWWTAHCAQEAYEEFQKKEGIRPNPFIYFIQDYEPGFYAWSTRYLLADATYRCDYPQIAVFNTGLLQEYFHRSGHSFFREYAFEPVLNDRLRECLDRVGGCFHKKKRILIYGRPGTERNAFKLIVAALKKWVWVQWDIEEWEILSAGEPHDQVYLGNGKYLRSVGKLSIEDYARMLAESYAGISLMASPHPSYPPLEMSVFGVRVITNTFSNKDLKNFNDNIVSLKNISPNNIVRNLQNVCDGYRPMVPHENLCPEYCRNENVFSFIGNIKTDLEEWENQL